MKKFKITGFILSILLLAGISFADVNFSGMAGGSTGISGITGDNQFLLMLLQQPS